jgi:Putative DNA-binding domain
VTGRRFRVHFIAINLTELLQRPEGKTLEFKRDLSSTVGMLRTVVAFANTAGGTILIVRRGRHTQCGRYCRPPVAGGARVRAS